MNATIQRVEDNFIVSLPASFVKNIKLKESEIVQVFEEYGRIVTQLSQLLKSPVKSAFTGCDARII